MAIKIGKCYEKTKQIDKAIEIYEKAVKIDKRKTANPLFRLAWALIWIGEKKQGILKLKEANKIEPNNVDVLIKLGEMLLRNNETATEAEKYLQRAVDVDNKNAIAIIALGRCKERKNEIDEAINFYEWAIKLPGNNVHALFYLGVIYNKR